MRRLIRYGERRGLRLVTGESFSRVRPEAAEPRSWAVPASTGIVARRLPGSTHVEADDRDSPSGNHRRTFAVSGAMTTGARPHLRFLLVAATVTLGLAACSGSAAPSASIPATIGPNPTPVPTADGGAGGGTSGGNAGSGGGAIIDPTPVDPAAGQPTIVVPKTGQKNVHPVSPTALQASVDGRRVLVKVTWWSGVEPCNVLDSVRVDQSGTDVAITIFEGSSNLDAVCIEIAQLKATIVDLGELEPGTWTISAPNSEAPPIEVTIS
jgi:hypothetical protein